MLYSEPLQLQQWVTEEPSVIDGLDSRPGLPFGKIIIQNHASGMLHLRDNPDFTDQANQWLDVHKLISQENETAYKEALNILLTLSEIDDTAKTALALLTSGGDVNSTLELLNMSAQLGCPHAKTCFAMLVMGTMGTESLYERARAYLDEAAEIGIPRAVEWRARSLLFGFLGVSDPVKGHDMMERQTLSNPTLFDNLYVGLLLYHQVVHPWEGGDQYGAIYWLEKAAEQGSSQASDLLVNIYSDSNVEPFNLSEARKWEQHSSDLKSRYSEMTTELGA